MSILSKASSVLAAFFLLASCGAQSVSDPKDLATSSEYKRVDVELGPYVEIAWPRQDELIIGRAVAERQVGSATNTFGLFQFRFDEATLEPLAPEPARNCRYIDYLHPRKLEDGLLGFVRVCSISVSRDRYDLFALDTVSGETEWLSRVPFNPATFTWNIPTGTGLVSSSTELCSKLVLLTRDGPKELPARVGNKGSRFRLDHGSVSRVGQDCRRHGLAGSPAWSPDGKMVSFFASPDSVGKSGIDKANSLWNLYLMNSEDLNPIPILRGIGHPRATDWSPDGNRLAFIGQIGASSGVWLFEIARQDTHLLAREEAESLAWSPSGRQLAVLLNRSSTGEWPPKAEIFMFKVADHPE